MERLAMLIYLVGSWPWRGTAANPEAAGAAVVEGLMRRMLTLAGSRLMFLGDGEPGRNYVQYFSESLRSSRRLRVLRDGDWSSFERRPVFARRHFWIPLPRFDSYLRLGRFVRRSYPVFCRLREEFKQPDLRFLVGLPSPLTLAAVIFDIRGPLYVGAFWRALRWQTYAIYRDCQRADGTSDVVFQIELPGETALLMLASSRNLPRSVRFVVMRLVIYLLTHWTRRAIRTLPHGANYTLHLCAGSLDNKAVAPITAEHIAWFVRLVHAVFKWAPRQRTLLAVHMPLRGADQAATVDTQFYQGLQQLRLPEGAAFVAGVVDPAQDFAGQRAVVASVLAMVPPLFRVHLATPCGCGRYAESEASAAVTRARELVAHFNGGTTHTRT